MNEKESLQASIKLLTKEKQGNDNSNEIVDLKQHIQTLVESKNKLETQHQVERRVLKVGSSVCL